MKLAGFPEREVHRPPVVKVVGSTGDPADKDAAIVNHALQTSGSRPASRWSTSR